MANKKESSSSSAFLKTTKKCLEAIARFASTPIRESPQSSPAASSSAAYYATPIDQVRAGFVLCGQGSYDWTKTAPASENVMRAFKNQFCSRQRESPTILFPSRGLFPVHQVAEQEDDMSVSAAKRSRTGASRYAPRSGQSYPDDQDETTEEEISFHLSQEMELESVDLPPIQRCVSASLPPNASSLRSRRRSISVETFQNLDTSSYREGSYSRKIDTQGNDTLFSDYRSPKNASGRTSGRKRSIFDELDDPDDAPLYSSSCSDNGSRCTSSLPFEMSASAGVTPHNHGSMLSSPDLSMERLALVPPPSTHPQHALPPPPPTLRSRSAPLMEALEEVSPPGGFTVNSSLFTPPRNRRDRSESFTDDLAMTFSNYAPLVPQVVAPPVPHEMLGGMFTPISSSSLATPSSTPRPLR
jgi:hypothetical protein